MGLGWHDVAQKLPKRIDFFEPDELDSRPFKFLPSALNFEGKLAAGATRLGVVALDKNKVFLTWSGIEQMAGSSSLPSLQCWMSSHKLLTWMHSRLLQCHSNWSQLLEVLRHLLKKDTCNYFIAVSQLSYCTRLRCPDTTSCFGQKDTMKLDKEFMDCSSSSESSRTNKQPSWFDYNIIWKKETWGLKPKTLRSWDKNDNCFIDFHSHFTFS